MLIVPTTDEVPDYMQTVVLDGTTYTMRLLWNGRDSSWYLTLYNASGEVLLHGVKIRIELDLCDQYVSRDLPTGRLIVSDPEQLRAEPSRDTLQDDRLPLIHVTDEDLGR
ncbi:MAG: hypothetical protein V2A73_16075 [Pseudomonadota bacterium]